MSTENPRGWDKPLSEYRALDLVLDRSQVADAMKDWAIKHDLIVEDGLDMPKDAHINMTVSGEKLRVQYVWRETEHSSALADAIEFLLRASTPDDRERAKSAAQEALAEWKEDR